MRCPYCTKDRIGRLRRLTPDLDGWEHMSAKIRPEVEGAYIDITTYWWDKHGKRMSDDYEIFITHCPRCGRRFT